MSHSKFLPLKNKIMKQLINRYLKALFFLTILVFVGCEDALIEKPVSVLAPQSFFKNDVDFRAAINGTIQPLWSGSCFGRNATQALCFGAPDASSRDNSAELMYYERFDIPTTENRTRQVWQYIYFSIRNCNAILSSLPLATNVSDNNKILYEAQARFIRAFDYFFLVRWYGEVPIITSDNFMDAANVPQSTVAAVYEYLLADLKFAEANLPEKSSSAPVTTPTKGAAKIMMAEAYLTMAGWPLKQTDKYALARDKAKEIIDGKVYSLEPNFGDLWLVKRKLSGPEHIFIMHGIAGTSSTCSRGRDIRPSEEGGWNDVSSEPGFYYEFPEGVRKEYTFWTTFTNGTHWTKSTINKPMMSKWRDSGAGGSRDQAYISGGDGFWSFWRFADALLIYAEAANMAEDGPSTLAYECINLIRARANGAGSPPLTPPMTKEEFDYAVFKERLYELAFELKPWFDMTRTDRVISEMSAKYPNVSRKHYYAPKPQTVVDISPGLKQSPGY